MKKLLLAFAIFAFLFSGCGGGGGSSSDTSGSIIHASAIALTGTPASQNRMCKAGDIWQYAGSGTLKSATQSLTCTYFATQTITAVNNETPTKLAQTTVATVKASNGKIASATTTTYFRQDEKTRDIFAVAKITEGTFGNCLPEYLTEPGTWALLKSGTASYMLKGVPYSIAYDVIDQEGLSCPVGQFNCWKMTTAASGNNVSSTSIVWIAPELGPVRIKEIASTSLDGQNYTMDVDATLQSAKIN